MDKLATSERIARILRDSREEADLTQEYMSRALGISRKTVQNWENGEGSPSLSKMFEWFDATGLHSLPYLLRLTQQDELSTVTDDDDQRVQDALIAYIKGSSPQDRRKLLFILFGDHGSSTKGVSEAIVAYLNIPLYMRLPIAASMLECYEIFSARTEKNENSEHPDVEYLKKALNSCRTALLSGLDDYRD